MPGRRLLFQGEMSPCWACSAGYKTRAQNARMVSEFSDTALQKLFQHLFKREITSHKVKEFLQHKFWSDLINISCVFIHVLFWHPRMKNDQWNIKLKTWSDPIYPVSCNEHFQVFFPHIRACRVQNRLMVWEFICWMRNTDDTLLTTCLKEKIKINAPCYTHYPWAAWQCLGINLILKTELSSNPK